MDNSGRHIIDDPAQAMTCSAESPKIDTGLECLALISNYHGIAIDKEQIRHGLAIGSEGMNVIDILRAARGLGLKARYAKAGWQRLSKLQLPAIAQKNDGQYFIIAKIVQDKALILDPSLTKPEALAKDELMEIWDHSLILFVRKGFSIESGRFNLRWFIPVIMRYRRILFEVLLASFITQLFALVTPIFTQVIIDKVLVHQGLTTLDVLALGLLAIAFFDSFLMIARTYVFNHTTSKIDVILGMKLFRHLLSLPLRYFEVRRVGDTIARVRELETIRNFLTGPPLTLLLDILFLFVFIIVMLFYSVELTLITLASLPFFIGLSIAVTPLLRALLNDRFNKGAESQSYLVEAVTGVQTVKSFALEPEVQKKWEGQLASYITASLRTSILGGTAGSLGQFIQKAANLAILYFGAKLVMAGDLTVGQLIAFQMLSGRVSGPILRMVQTWQDFQQVGISIQRLGDILNSTPEPSTESMKTRLPAIRGHVRMENVSFRYRVDGSQVLHDFSVDIRPGTVIGIVGRSGSGKSTLAKLIQRLYIPESGRILIDGVDIAIADPTWLRRQIGVVLQENFLFNASVRDNIAIHYPAASMNDIVRVSQLAGAHQFILELPDGYDTVVGERGTALSGGQRQRIAIARALLMNPRLLIFDEATSALDYESERIIQRNLGMICQGRTVIIIAHRLSTIRNANRILVVDRGQLVEAGSHQELISRKGLYHHLFQQQEDDDHEIVV